MQTSEHHILILGGTKEARELAEALAEQGYAVTFALFSPTGKSPPPKGCTLRVGSFGGQDGLVDFIGTEGVTVLVNGLHPHALVMQRRAQSVSEGLSIPTFRLERPLWNAQPGDDWQQFAWVEEISDALRQQQYRRIFCAVGPQAMRMFLPLTQNATLYARRFDASRGPLNDSVSWIEGAPHPTVEAEIELFQKLDVQALMTKNSGGQRPAKLDAAQRLGLPVYLLKPQPLTGPSFDDWRDIQDRIRRLTDPEAETR